MLTPVANIHRSKLPSPGAIVVVRTRPLGPGHRYRRFIVESYPLCDSPVEVSRTGEPVRYSLGIHTVTLRALDNSERVRVAGHWCVEECDL